MSYRIFLDDDDRREPRMFARISPIFADGEPWARARNFDELTRMVAERGIPSLISYDHDLAEEHYDPTVDPGDYKEKTGLECARWFASHCRSVGERHPPALVHSMNPSGGDNIRAFLRSQLKNTMTVGGVDVSRIEAGDAYMLTEGGKSEPVRIATTPAQHKDTWSWMVIHPGGHTSWQVFIESMPRRGPNLRHLVDGEEFAFTSRA